MTDFNYMKLLREGVEKELPSGLVVRLRPIDAGMILTEKMSEPLQRIVKAHLLGVRPKELDDDGVLDESLTSVTKIYDSARTFGEFIASKCIVYPRIVEHPATIDEIALREIGTDDLLVLSQVIGVPLKELSSFRFQQTETVESVSDEQGTTPDTESDTQS